MSIFWSITSSYFPNMNVFIYFYVVKMVIIHKKIATFGYR